MNDPFESIFSHWNAIDRSHERKDELFRCLLCEPLMRTPQIGDHVIVAAGLLDRGHDWIRKEVKVIDIADTSVKIRWLDGLGIEDQWIHPVLITDILEKHPSSPETNPAPGAYRGGNEGASRPRKDGEDLDRT